MIAKRNSIGIHHKITLIFLVVILFLTTLSSGIIYWQFKSIMSRQLIHDMDQIMKQNKVNLNNLVSGLDKATLLLYSDQSIMNILNKEPSDFMQTYKDIEALNNELMKYIYFPLNSMLTSYSVSFFVTDKLPFTQELPTGSDFFYGFYNWRDVMGEKWLQQTLAGDGTLVWFKRESESRMLYAARLIKNPEALSNDNAHLDKPLIENVGVVVIGFDTAQLGKQLEASQLTQATHMILLDEEGNAIYRQDAQPGVIPPDVYLHAPSGSIVKYGQQYAVSHHELTSGWQLFALIPLSDISEQASFVRNIVGTTALVSLFAGLLLSVLISNRISAPIRRLARTMKVIQITDKLDVYLDPPVGKDEVSFLFKSFNNMMRRINRLVGEVYESGIREKEAELKALQAQINPHFLYNTLDSVNWLALKSGIDPISEINSSLANMLRYITKDSDTPTSIAEELEQVKRYIAIQSHCYENRFDVHYKIDPAVLNTPCPKLIIQPLVENAFIHGIDNTGMTGSIELSAYKDGNAVVVMVGDNGQGADIDRMNAIATGKEVAGEEENQSCGIKNVNRRIVLKYGEMYGLHYESNADGGVAAIVRLPCNADDETATRL
ncbi:histidine kinase [Paenibacillus sp. HB172176]|uniref:cache domain-containing sensor histidine kinase n=1 Tax=Paenibacillus sp. HB172176 TaxID=2493690 RepID=UPI00143CA4B5|nr:histidine kinase [Paenibacillus sp. HB172176]